jgi:hypothetical protein
MKNLLFGLLFGLGALSAQGQTLAKSIFAEYGYVNIPADSVVLHTMFGITRYRLYADDQYIKLETYQNLSEKERKQVGPSIRSLLVKERASNDVYLCISFDTLQIRMKGEEKEREAFQRMSELFNSKEAAVFGNGRKTAAIQGFNCSELFVKGAYSDTVSSFITNQVILDQSIQDFPLYVSNNGVSYGLMLGRDEVLWNGQTIEFRAVKLDINAPMDIRAELNQYQLVSKEKGNKLLKEIFTKSMGIPEEKGRN